MNALYDFFQTDWTEQVDFMLFIYLVAITAEAMSGALAAGRRVWIVSVSSFQSA